MTNVCATPVVPRTAATVMLVRETSDGIEVFLVRRSAKSRFMPGVFVFPGGAVDAVDAEAVRAGLLPDPPPEPNPEIVAAALRETFEEAGVLVARRRDESVRGATTGTGIDRDLLAGGSFAAALDAAGLVLDGSRIAYYSRWITPASEPIRFDTHFFLAEMPPEQRASADTYETEDGTWLSPAEALAAAERGELALRFPTRKHLERLAEFRDLATLTEHARSRRVGTIEPVERGGEISFDESAW